MAREPLTVCGHADCGTLIRGGGRCPIHRRPRPSAAAQGYDARWRKARAAYLLRHPTCQHPGCRRPSRDVHHVDLAGPLGPRGFDESNFLALCASHHAQITARTTGFGRSRQEIA